jgi:murein DD-endopeptidase MepM/ murein hydrolase activator NlpD
MRNRPEFAAIVVLVMLVGGASLLSRPNVGTTPVERSTPIPSPIIAEMPSTPTSLPTLSTNTELALELENTPTPPPTLPPLPSDNDRTPLAASAPQIPLSEIVATSVSTPQGYNPPPLEVPLAINPNDHFWMVRPLDSDKTNSGLPTYQFGSNGSTDEFRMHHGIDIPNPNGTQIRAAGSGTVIWAARGLKTEFEYIGCYANVIVIEHDVGFQGEPIYSLYAHLFAMLVEEGEHVESSQPIALTGSTGCSSGPHLHFEVRVGENGYNFARNPVLWMAPYTGTGVIAGTVTYASGKPIYDAPITVIDLETGRVAYRQGAYAAASAQPDPAWNETFAIGDVPAGRYLVTSYFGSTTWSGEVTVVPGATSWVNMIRYEATEREEQ